MSKEIFLHLEQCIDTNQKVELSLFTKDFLQENLYKTFVNIRSKNINELQGFKCVEIEDNRAMIRAVVRRSKTYNAINSTVAQLALMLKNRNCNRLLHHLMKHKLDLEREYDYSLNWDSGECRAPLIYQAAMENNEFAVNLLLNFGALVDKTCKIGKSKKNLGNYLIDNVTSESIKALLVQQLNRERVEKEKLLLMKKIVKSNSGSKSFKI